MVFLCEELFREAAGSPGVALVGDVVAVEDAARPVPRDFHVHRFGDSRSWSYKRWMFTTPLASISYHRGDAFSNWVLLLRARILTTDPGERQSLIARARGCPGKPEDL